MFRRKTDVDKHAASVLSKKRNDKERSALGFQIAKLYAEINEYSTAKMYLSGYLKIQKSVPQAHQLMGEIDEALGLKEIAAASYRRALDLSCPGVTQKHLMNKICDLYSELGLSDERLKYCIEKCEDLKLTGHFINRFQTKVSSLVHVPAVSVKVESNEYIMKEIKTEKNSPGGGCNILSKSDTLENRYAKAVEHILSVDQIMDADLLIDFLYVLKEYGTSQFECTTDPVFNLIVLYVHRNLTLISCKDFENFPDYFAGFDEEIKHCESLYIHGEAWNTVFNEIKGQLFFIAGIHLLEKAHSFSGLVSWEKAKQYAGLCFTACESVGPIDDQLEFFQAAPYPYKMFYKWWYLHSFDRLSQAGHVLMQLSCGEFLDWSLSAKQYLHSTYAMCMELYPTVLELEKTFLFCGTKAMVEAADLENWVSDKKLLAVDKVAVELHHSSLQNIVWLCLQHYSLNMDAQPSYDFFPIETSLFKAKHLPGASDKTLSHLDLFVFLLASVRCASMAQWIIEDKVHGEGCPLLLPPSVQSLCTEEQEAWWLAAYRFCTQTNLDQDSRLWSEVRQGVETVRMVGQHGLSVMMISHIARSMDAKVKTIIGAGFGSQYSAADLMALENLADFFWDQTKQALNKNSYHLSVGQNSSLFQEKGDHNIPVDVLAKINEEVKFALAFKALGCNDLKASLVAFGSIKSLRAKYYMAQVYTLLFKSTFENQTTERDEHGPKLFLLKARHYLQEVKDKLHKEKGFKSEVLSFQEFKELHKEVEALYERCCSGDLARIPKQSSRLQDVHQTSQTASSSSCHNPSTLVCPDTQGYNVPRRSESGIESLMMKMLVERNHYLIQQNGKLVEELYNRKQELCEKEFHIQKLKTDLLTLNLLHSHPEPRQELACNNVLVML